MMAKSLTLAIAFCVLVLMSAGCGDAPGKPRLRVETDRPEQVASFIPLYGQNCAGCHGTDGKGGAAISLANPVYLATAGAVNIERVTNEGVAGTMMPPFGKPAGGMLTERQISILAQGMLTAWGRHDLLAASTPPQYQATLHGDPVDGEKTYATFCARCHGEDAAGTSQGKGLYTGSLVDPAYLALVSDQDLRSFIIAGDSSSGMPDWRSDLTGSDTRPMTDQEVTDTVAWLASHRIELPGQPYPKNQQ